MAIRFRCGCGALFEVAEENAGKQGRCKRCGSDMIIPAVSHETPDAADRWPSPPPRSSASGAQTTPAERHPHRRARFCPFCGVESGEEAEVCPSCFRRIKKKKIQNQGAVILTPIEWVLVTLFAPLGFLGGFVNLVMGNRKGLHMIGISTLSMLMMWVMLQVMNWLA